MCILLLTSQLQAQKKYEIIKDIKKGNLEGVKQAIESGVSANSIGGRFKESLLNIAADNGHIEIVKYLIAQGAEINKVTGVYGGMTPLIRASQNCNVSIVKLLIDKGANPNLTNKGSFYTNPLYSAAKNGCLDVAKLLLSHNADINFSAGTGHTVLTGAIVSSTKSEAAIMLVESGADVNKTAYGKHPVHIAIEEFPIISNYNPRRDNKRANGFIQLIELIIDRVSRTDRKEIINDTLIELVQKKFDRFYEPLVVEINLKKKDTYHVEGEVKSVKPQTTKSQMEQFYRQKAKEIIDIIHKYKQRR